jgi:hypothetical protein
MLSEILQDVDQGVPHFARCPECAGMEAVCPNLSAAADGPIDRLRDADGEPLHAATQGDEAVAFDQQMDVIALHAEVDDSKRFS